MTSPQPKIVVFGNSGSGKTTLARRLGEALGAAVLDLDAIAWAEGTGEPTRRPLAESAENLEAFMNEHERGGRGWVVEGCYGDLIEIAAARATELRFLNPGTEVCLERNRRRAWDPDRFPTAEEQAAALPDLLGWVAQYGSREDEFSLRRHREIFAAFPGSKLEETGPGEPLAAATSDLAAALRLAFASLPAEAWVADATGSPAGVSAAVAEDGGEYVPAAPAPPAGPGAPFAEAGSGLPGYRVEEAPGERWRSRYDRDAGVVVINGAHRNFIYSARDEVRKRRYIGRLFAKEFVLAHFKGSPPEQLLEHLVEISLYTEDHLG